MASDNQKAIDQMLATLDENQRMLEDKALLQGHKDEVCGECGTVLLAFHHFLTCRSETCPMKLRDETGKAPSLLVMMRDGVPEDTV